MALRDYLNFESYADFANFTLQNGQAVAILTMDGVTPLETWYFNASSMAVPNGTTVFKPNAIPITSPGRYIKNMTSSDWDTTLNKPVFADVALSGNYNDLENKLVAGVGIIMNSGNEISVDDNQFMSKEEANEAILLMQADIATRVPEPRTITINGITQDLEANRDWEVGDLSSSASYNNPSWLNSLSVLKVTDLKNVAKTGSYNDLVDIPNLGNYYLASNPNGYISVVPAQSWSSITGKPVFSTVATTNNYNDLSNKPTIPTVSNSSIISALGFTPYNSTNPNGYVNQSGARAAVSLTTSGTSGASTYDSSTGVLNIPNYVSNTYTAGGGITISSNVISQAIPTYNNSATRALTTSFRPSTTRPTRVSYTCSITTALSLLNLNSSGVVQLQISPDNTNWTTINSAGITRTLAVSLSVGLNETSMINVAGEIPSNFYCRLLPTTSGGATVVISSGQEVTY